MTTPSPDKRGAAADRIADDQVATGDELFEAGEAQMPPAADMQEALESAKGGDVKDARRQGWKPGCR